MKKNVDYVLFVLVLAFTTFEFFFREEMLFWFLALIVGCVFIGTQRVVNVKSIYVIFFLFVLLYVFQYLYQDRYKITSIISRCITLFGSFFIAYYFRKRFVKIFVDVIYYISIISLLFYGLSFIPSIKSFLMYQIAPHFVSLNVEEAVQEGGGINILFYNFQTEYLLPGINMMRNCGPFWEPGMFAVYLSIALFFNLFAVHSKRRYCNIIFVLSLITTFSTGGYVSGLFILVLYAFQQKNIFLALLGIGCVVMGIWGFMNLDFVGKKIIEQMNSATLGDGRSRFGAFISQIELIKMSPLFGGADFTTLTGGDRRTLASGTLLPFILYGIPVGIVFYGYMLKAVKQLLSAYTQYPYYGIMFFVLLLILSFSQTIFSQEMFLIILFVGLMTQKKQYERI